jgi:hypothetical protein
MYSLILLVGLVCGRLASAAPTVSCGAKGFEQGVGAYDSNSSSTNYASYGAMGAEDAALVTLPSGSDGRYFYSVSL